MIHGIHIHPYMVSGVITTTVVTFRMLAMHFQAGNPVIEFFINPIVVFILLLIAGVVVLYPHLRGPKAIVLSVVMVAFISLFVYSYYIL